MNYCMKKVQKVIDEILHNNGNLSLYNDILCGSQYLETINKGSIADNNIILMLSIDGAQLYKSKQSDCWLYI
ncbi:hypothetical protein HYDPIDRAFT_103632 [Hydnomerulius pinastri MD-312]|uniref:Uncharacterized protein n=1 Tax=Hydnomerulius pinastri MD-312 TaxID=994086 RepID=A0A0C9VX59_9AGAM|nr:hypothetical protein HYDPIDRAFT_103632 [Hydnomerulius pinastri MD-312]